MRSDLVVHGGSAEPGEGCRDGAGNGGVGPVSIHLSAVIGPGARIPDSCTVGPFCTVGAEVELGEECQLISHVA